MNIFNLVNFDNGYSLYIYFLVNSFIGYLLDIFIIDYSEFVRIPHAIIWRVRRSI